MNTTGGTMDKQELEEQIQKYVRANADGKEIITGWVLSLSVKHPAANNSDGYIVENSEGLPYHSQLGLLMAAMDEKKNIILSQVIREE
jgi:hypothetical protein